ncbi:MAG: hypothetical protein K0R31_1696 [Clostridiales bacterium]|nr:hypothetical protein [Clostridiales bacterium]
MKMKKSIFMKKVIALGLSTFLVLGSVPVAFAQNDKDATLKSLDVSDSTQQEIFDTKSFDPNKTEYSVKVQSDIYGVLVKANALSKEATVKVTAATTPGTYTTPGSNEPLEVAYDNTYGGYVVPLSQTYEDYTVDYSQKAYIDVSLNGETKRYTITINRDNDSYLYDLFQKKAYTAKDGTVLPYNFYVPSNYDPDKKYPVILVLHGVGQRAPGQPLDMVLKRTRQATVWAEDSEKGIRQCIVIAPQSTVGWGGAKGVLTTDGQAAYELLQSTISAFSIDKNRVYITGLSMGGRGAWTVMYNHASDFAAAMPVCGFIDDKNTLDYTKFAPLSGRIWTFQAVDDPTVKYSSYETIADGLTSAGVEFKGTVYPSGTFFNPNPHFSWIPAYANEKAREWLFSKTR